MTEWIWIDGETIPMSEARISVEDRGFQFADGVYEVIRIYDGKPFTLTPHLDRLDRSSRAILIEPPVTHGVIADAITDLIERSKLRDGIVYIQVTRGASPRNHLFPEETKPTLLAYVRVVGPAPMPGEGEGVKLLAIADERWKRCWIKSVALLPNILAKNEAAAAGADEAVFIENGVVSECNTCNIFAVIGQKLVTHPVGSKVLPGITRAVVLELAEEMGIEVEERQLRDEEAARANELFVTSTTREIAWVARWNERYIGQGRCGPITMRLHRAYRERVQQDTASPVAQTV